ncbi:hypothetical protein FVD52_14295, partial [Enterococcus faecium]|nr:hypothetical protein [Enterococcus faecium]
AYFAPPKRRGRLERLVRNKNHSLNFKVFVFISHILTFRYKWLLTFFPFKSLIWHSFTVKFILDFFCIVVSVGI